jgi:hypothetical protein
MAPKLGQEGEKDTGHGMSKGTETYKLGSSESKSGLSYCVAGIWQGWGMQYVLGDGR